MGTVLSTPSVRSSGRGSCAFPRRFICLLLAVASQGFLACGDSRDEWVEFEIPGCFSFEAPPDLALDPQHTGIDSLSQRYTTDDIELFFDYGPWSGSGKDIGYRAFVTKSVTIDGREATLSTFEDPSRAPHEYVASAHLRDVRPPNPFPNHLTMSVSCTSAGTRDRARRILESLAFR